MAALPRAASSSDLASRARRCAGVSAARAVSCVEEKTKGREEYCSPLAPATQRVASPLPFRFAGEGKRVVPARGSRLARRRGVHIQRNLIRHLLDVDRRSIKLAVPTALSPPSHPLPAFCGER